MITQRCTTAVNAFRKHKPLFCTNVSVSQSLTAAALPLQQGIRKPFSELVSNSLNSSNIQGRISDIAKRHTMLISGLVISVRYMAGDALTQKLIEKKNNLDMTRTQLFGTFGLVAGLGPYHWIYNRLYRTAPFLRLGALGIALFDCVVALPTWYFLSFYVFREVGFHSCASNSLLDTVQSGVQKWKADYWENTRLCLTIPLVQVVAMVRYVPPHLGSTFIGVSGFAWVIVVSMFRGGRKEEEESVLGLQDSVAEVKQPTRTRPVRAVPVAMSSVEVSEASSQLCPFKDNTRFVTSLSI